MNTITETQNSDDYLRLLRARSRVYQEAGWFQAAQLTVVVLMPILAAIAGLIWPDSRPYVGALALCATFADVLWLDRAQRNRTKIGARIGEIFDCGLFGMDWNEFVAGPRLDEQTISELEQAWSKGDDKLRDWYKPVQLAELPLHVARVICQHTNLWYDGRLRRRVGAILAGAAIALATALAVTGIVLHLSFSDFVLTVVAPAAPLMTWASREYYRQRDTADVLDTIKTNADALWAKVVARECESEACSRRSREFQDAIYARRAHSPLHVPFAYDLLRTKMETAMEAGGNAMLKQYQAAA